MFPIQYTPATLDDAVVWMAMTASTGGLRLEGDICDGTLHFKDGRLVYGSIDWDRPVPEDLDDTGITSTVWLRALASEQSDDDFAGALLAAGADPAAVDSFAVWSIDRAFERLRENRVGTITTNQATPRFRSTSRHEVTRWLATSRAGAAEVTVRVDPGHVEVEHHSRAASGPGPDTEACVRTAGGS
jgi:hypothetical protein